MPDSDLASLRQEVLGYLHMLQRSGFVALPLVQLPVPVETEDTPPAESPAPAEPDGQIAMDLAAATAKPQDLTVEDKARKLAELASEVAQCRKCGLCQNRTKTVPGEGSPNAQLVFVGEAPGYYEDVQGRPFVGRAGELLTKMIEAMHLRREDVFICNVIKCRPPENRNPVPTEIQACEGYLLRQLDILSPKLIVVLGNFAAQCLLATRDPISRLRGQWREYHGIPLMPTYHPAYLLRNSAEKRKCWDDLQKVMVEYERLVGPLPPR